MDNRERVIQEIERLRNQPSHDERRIAIEKLIHDLNTRSYSQFRRKPLVVIATVVLLLPFLILSPRGINPTTSGALPIWVVYVWIVGGLFGTAWIWHKLPKHLNLGPVSIDSKCCACRYDLNGHDSILGADLWVGPEICPECGQTYPAIG